MVVTYEESETYQCPKCDGFFNSAEYNFDSHPCILPCNKFQCSYCLRFFSQRGEYEQHKKRHISRKDKYECKICKKTFTHATNRHRHLKSHFTHMKYHKCEICGQSFVRKDTFKAHQRAQRCHAGMDSITI